MNAPERASLRLTEFSHGGGCGCKIAPALLREIIGKAGQAAIPAQLLVGMPIDRLPVETIRRILDGGEAICAAAGIPIAGGHTIDSVEPIYGLVAIGLVDPANLKRNAGARPGDALVLGKPLGIGVYSAARKKDRLSVANHATLIACTTH